MIPHVPEQRQFKSNAAKPFNDLVAYVEAGKEQEQGPSQELSNQFDDILNYSTAAIDTSTKAEKCLAIRTQGVYGISTASAEMNAIAKKNRRCEDPAYHIILSWPEHEHPAPDNMFDAAEHALKALGLAEHQYVLAVHGNTDNDHCHICVNRVHPVTFQSRHIEWSFKTLHMAARESEIKHGWSHDNGIYVVKTDGHGKKSIVLNMDYADAMAGPTPAANRFGTEKILPTWHDPDSLESWLKTKVSKALKHDLATLDGWPALHAWLEKQDITLSDTGGGGMRLHATVLETGEILDMAASKGLRILKRGDLEKRWGTFANSTPMPSIVPDTTHLTPGQLNKGIEEVLNRSPGKPPDHVLARTQGLGRPAGQVPGTEHHPDGNVPERSGSKRSLARDDSQRAQRKEQRAAARADLRLRFSQYKRFVAIGDIEHFKRLKEAKSERSLALKDIHAQCKAAKAAIPKGSDQQIRLIATVEIDAESLRRKLQAESVFQDKAQSLRATRTPPLSWRAWLCAQSNLADQAAISALRGIVYQAQRDAKKDSAIDPDDIETEQETDTEAGREQQYRKLMERLLKEEQAEVAIRSAQRNAMRPYEVDALLARYTGIQFRVTGNGNIEYRDQGGDHLFTDRGNRITFDRVRVSDEDICLALVHARQKFSSKLTLTGNDPIFTARMACLADDMGITILNPEMRIVIEHHRLERIEQTAKVAAAAAEVLAPTIEKKSIPQESAVAMAAETVTAPQTNKHKQSAQERLRAMVLSIDPRAEFVVPEASGSQRYTGPVAATLIDAAPGFAQHTARSTYVLHTSNPPEHDAGAVIEVQYTRGRAVAVVVIAPAPATAIDSVASKKSARRAAAVAVDIPAAIDQPAPEPESKPLSAHTWLEQWAAVENKTIVLAIPENAEVAYTVVHVAADGIVLNKGRTGAVYPVPPNITLRVGDKVVVDRNGEICWPRTPEQAGGKNSPGR
ncbi:MAG: TraI/MobA(P) family conjugative relaxase [Cypionkella sp.]